MRLSVEVQGLEAATRPFDRLGRRLRDPGEILVEAVDTVAEANVARIRAGAGRKLAPSTLRQKRRLGQPATPLIGEGKLLRSLKPGGPGSIVRVQGETATYGTSVFYARFQKKRGGRSVISVRKPTRLLVAQQIRRDLLAR